MTSHWANRRQTSLAACVAAGLNLVILTVLGLSPAIALSGYAVLGA